MKRVAASAVTSLVMGLFLIPAPAISAPPGAPPGPPPGGDVVSVDCGSGDTIADALANAKEDRPLIVNIEGVCNENVTITKNEVTLLGTDPLNDGIRGVLEIDPIKEGPITIIGAVNVVVENLTITNGGTSGIAVVNGRADVRNSIVEDNANSGIGAGIFAGAGALVTVDNVIVQDNENAGVSALRGGSVVVINSTIQNNAWDGIFVGDGGSARIGTDVLGNPGPTTIQNNTRNGINIEGSGSARIHNSTITGNEISGVGVFNGSSAHLMDNQITDHPSGYGVLLAENSQVWMTGNTVDGSGANIEFGAGVAAGGNSTIRMAGGNTVINSGWAAVDVARMSIFRASGGSGETLTNTGTSNFGRPRSAIDAFQSCVVDLRGGTTVIGRVDVAVQSMFRSRENTIIGDVDVTAHSGLGLRNTVTLVGTITCDSSSFTYSNNGGPHNCP